RLLLIGVGGVATPEQALAKFRAGASLVQVYTAFVYQGPSLLPRLAAGLSALLDQYGAATLAELVGRDADRLAEIAP
ncbi:Dihydroorotate dehydrogenase 2, partial [Acidiphilium sp. PM]